MVDYRRRGFQRYSGYIYLLPYLILFTIFILVPLIYGFLLSFFHWELASASPARFIFLNNYKEAIQSGYFWKATGATLQFVVWVVPLGILLALLVALGISTISRSRQSIYRTAYFLPTIISISVAGIIWRWFYNSEFGLFNELLKPIGWKIYWISDISLAMKSIVLMTIWWTSGGLMIILLAGILSISPQYYEAAVLDGAGPLQRFRHITLPLLRPVLLFVLVINTIASFQVFGQTFMITRGGPELSTRVLVQYIYETAFTHYRMGYGAALSWILFSMIALFSVFQFRLFREK